MQIYRFGRLFDVAWPALQSHLRAALQEGLTSRSWTRWENWNTDSTDVLSLQVCCCPSDQTYPAWKLGAFSCVIHFTR